MKKLDTPAATDFQGPGSIAEMASAEGWEATEYVIGLADYIRCNKTSMANQAQRLKALAQVGARGDFASADALSHHFLLLEALLHRWSYEATKWAASGDKRGPEYSERFMNSAVKAQAAAARCLSALKVLRDTPSAGEAPTAPATTSMTRGIEIGCAA